MMETNRAAQEAQAQTEAANAEYMQELERMRSDLRQLREKMLTRVVQRINARTGRPASSLLATNSIKDYPPLDESKQIWEQQLAQLLAKALIESMSNLPLDSKTVHDRLERGPAGEKYKRLLSLVGLPNPDAILVKFCLHKCIEALALEVADMPRLFVPRLDPMRLTTFTNLPGMEATMMAMSGAMMPPLGPNPMMMGGLARPPFPPGVMNPMMAGPGGPFPMPRPPLGGPGMLPPGPPPLPPGQSLPPPPGQGTPPSASVPMQQSLAGGAANLEGLESGGLSSMQGSEDNNREGGRKRGREADMDGADLDSLLNYKSASVGGGQAAKGGTNQLLEVLAKPSAREKATLQYFKSEGVAIKEHCPHLTREECNKKHQGPFLCDKLHFRKIIHPWTDERLGNCSYLNTCRNIRNCRYVHYEVDPDDELMMRMPMAMGMNKAPPVPKYLQALPQPQWVKCDIRTLDMTVLGKFGVIMADPPWQIHQDLPYGTMEDDEMRRMNIGCLQDHGVIFLWVTGRAMELGRECLKIWGYDRVDELIWVKTNQLQRLNRMGRTGHWLNHSKEHCLIGVKGQPALNRFVDCDVLVSEVRETSRKPDEMYSLLERLSPGTRKLEIFARTHNLKPGWVGLGNQLDGVQILEKEMKDRYEARYGRAGADGKLPLNF